MGIALGALVSSVLIGQILAILFAFGAVWISYEHIHNRRELPPNPASEALLYQQRFTALTHEIKNPLTPIRGYARLLQEELALGIDADHSLMRKGLSIILGEADRIEERLQQALTQLKGASHATSAVSVAKVLCEVAELVDVSPHVTRVYLDVASDLPRVAANRDELHSVLYNLFKNASESMSGQPGTIDVRVGFDAERVHICVRDQGSGLGGMSAGALMQSFLTTKPHGMGMGLTVIRVLLEGMGGAFELRERDGARGTEAHVWLQIWRS